MNTLSRKTAIIMAGGTGGHIFPGLAVTIARTMSQGTLRSVPGALVCGVYLREPQGPRL